MAKRVDAKQVVTYAFIAAYAATSVFVRFSNPAMTETQLLIKFWPLWVFGGGMLLFLVWWNGK